MSESNQQIISELVEYIKDKVIPTIPLEINQLNGAVIEELCDKLYILIYYCSQKDFDYELLERLNNLLETARNLKELLESNENAFKNLKEMYRMRRLDIGSDIMVQFEEIISGEEDFRDIIITSFATLLGWLSDTIWVDMAKFDQLAIPNSHIIKLKDELWKLIREPSSNKDNLTIEKAIQINEKMQSILKLISSDEIPAIGRVLFISKIYTLLIRIKIDRILINIKSCLRKPEGV
ncbi:MAG: hypothetical protein ACUVWN_06960 [bacterium]